MPPQKCRWSVLLREFDNPIDLTKKSVLAASLAAATGRHHIKDVEAS
jgi:hypothetical protein